MKLAERVSQLSPSPTMAVSARTGAGFGVGANMVGFPR